MGEEKRLSRLNSFVIKRVTTVEVRRMISFGFSVITAYEAEGATLNRLGIRRSAALDLLIGTTARCEAGSIWLVARSLQSQHCASSTIPRSISHRLWSACRLKSRPRICQRL
jgi:hypothetical protein